MSPSKKFLARLASSLVLTFFLFVLSYPRMAAGTSVNTLDLSDLIKKADFIADVTVTALQSYPMLTADGRAIHTRVTLKLNGAPIKGNVSSPVTLDMLGGTLDGKRLAVEGVPQLEVGQRLIIFSHSPNNFYVSPFIGMDQGAIRVAHDQITNTDRVFRWWGQPVKESEPMNSSRSISAAGETISSGEEVNHFMQRIKQISNR